MLHRRKQVPPATIYYHSPTTSHIELGQEALLPRPTSSPARTIGQPSITSPSGSRPVIGLLSQHMHLQHHQEGLWKRHRYLIEPQRGLWGLQCWNIHNVVSTTTRHPLESSLMYNIAASERDATVQATQHSIDVTQSKERHLHTTVWCGQHMAVSDGSTTSPMWPTSTSSQYEDVMSDTACCKTSRTVYSRWHHHRTTGLPVAALRLTISIAVERVPIQLLGQDTLGSGSLLAGECEEGACARRL
jgi:hypothetical protein